MTRIDPQVDFNWNWQSPGPGVPREYFSVRWTGKLYAPTTGKYRFSATVDDGVRVWVNGRKVIDEWRKQDDSQFVGEIDLKGWQLYDLRIEYYNDWKGSVISVFWELPEDRPLISFGSKPNKVIPAKYLFRKPSVLQPIASARLPATPNKLPPDKKSLVAGKPAPILAMVRSKPTVSTLTFIPAKQTVIPRPSALATLTQTPEHTPIMDAPTAPVKLDPPIMHFKVGESITLQHVVFTQSEYTLLPESYAELDKLVRVLQADSTLRIELAGHTDNVGDKRLNLALSEHRAKVVASYLCRHGIADTRITTKGYGGSRPIADNTNEAQRAQNRRVELMVLN
jgi:outer membrane protein OmpA-like peptidoglycan-associated protein